MSRCTGHCCQTFTLPLGPDELMDIYRRWADPMRKDGQGFPDRTLSDIHLIAPMVTYLGFFLEPPVKVVNTVVPHAAHYYSCKHFNREKKICTIYEDRPGMCRDYPYGRKCNYAECTWSEEKAEKKTGTEDWYLFGGEKLLSWAMRNT